MNDYPGSIIGRENVQSMPKKNDYEETIILTIPLLFPAFRLPGTQSELCEISLVNEAGSVKMCI